MKFLSILHGFCDGLWPNFRWFFDDFPVRAFTSDETSRTLFLNNSIVFCAQNQGFTLSVKHEFSWFSWSFSIPVLASIFDAFWHRFWLHFGSLLALIFNAFRDWFLNVFSITFLMENGSQKGHISAWRGELFSHLFASPSAGCLLMVLWSTLGSLLAPFWLPLAPFWLAFGTFWLPSDSISAPFGLTLAPCSLTFGAL